MADIGALFIGGVIPSVNVQGNQQHFNFAADSQRSIFDLNNPFDTTTLNAETHHQLKNINHKGYAISHYNSNASEIGVLKIQYFINNGLDGSDYTPLMTLTPDGVDFNVDVNIPIPANIATIEYVDNHDWYIADILDFYDAKLNDFALPDGDLDLNHFKIINLATPILDYDAATKKYVDDKIGTVSQVVTLIGAVSGSGNTGSSISTTLNTTLNNVPLATGDVNINNHKITNILAPDAANDATNKLYVDTKIVNANLSFIGKIYGTGLVGNDITLSLNASLSDLSVPTNDFSFNNNKLHNFLLLHQLLKLGMLS